MTGVQADLAAAVEIGQKAVDATAEEDPRRATYLFNLGLTLEQRFAQTEVQLDYDAPVAALAAASGLESAVPSTRINAARAAARLVAGPDTGRAADLLEAAVRMLSEMPPRQLNRSDQQYALGSTAGLASDAAAAMALSGSGGAAPGRDQAIRALRLLESGRAVLLSQALDARDDLTDLREQHPGLAERFTVLRDRLDQPEAVVALSASGWSAPAGSAAQLTEYRRRLAGEFAETLARIRSLDGFASFGLPPAAGELLEQAAAGPIVTFNISSQHSDALLLTADA